MIAIVHSIYSQSVHALGLNAGPMDNDAGRYCTVPLQLADLKQIIHNFKIYVIGNL